MGTLSLITSNGQYKKYTYTHGGASTTGVHVFTTQSGQSVAPAISTTKKPLSQLNPLSVSPSNVIAKTNGCMYEYYENKFYGFFYQGSGNPMYINGTKYTTLPTSSIMYTDPKYFPSFCIKSDGTATIRFRPPCRPLFGRTDRLLWPKVGRQTCHIVRCLFLRHAGHVRGNMDSRTGPYIPLPLRHTRNIPCFAGHVSWAELRQWFYRYPSRRQVHPAIPE